MKITKAEDYAITFVSALVSHYQGNDYLSIAEIAAVYNLPRPFLKKIAERLKTAGLLAVKEGRHGGYRLRRSPQNLSVGSVLRAFNPQPFLTTCLVAEHQARCPLYDSCVSRSAWEKITARLYRDLHKLKFENFIKLQTLNADVARKKP
ncbi:MAG: Rrf2 family transcriptional regulator [Candidatus Doudnabacteria bacterium]|nr:Rrf2 family transcriptional regulator [Candidatus Doudnabacteria bacterium]